MRERWLAIVCLGACAGPPEATWVADEVRGGSRLRARFQEEPGGARWFLGFHDAERDEDCSFARSPDGVTARCLPATMTAVFLDADCTTPVGLASPDPCATSRHYVSLDTDGCRNVFVDRIFAVGEAAALTTVHVRDAATGACGAVAASPSYVYYPATEEVPLDAFVSAELITAGGSGRLRERTLVADDGSRLPIDAFDTVLGVPCEILSIYGQLPACHPETAVEGGWYWTDATCTTSVVSTDVDCAGEAGSLAAVWTQAEPDCWTRSIFALGDPVTPGELYVGMGSCDALDPIPPDQVFFALGDATPAADLAAAARARSGSGRLLRYAQRGDGASALEELFRDTLLGVDCLPEVATDGVTRCLPEDSYVLDLFSDPGCNTTVSVAVSSPRYCSQVWPLGRYAKGYVSTAQSCTVSGAVYEVGAALEPGSLYTFDEGGACGPASWDPAEVRYFAFGPEVSPEQFVGFAEVVE